MVRYSFASLACIGLLLLGCTAPPAESDATVNADVLEVDANSVANQRLKALYPFAFPVGPASGDLGGTYPGPGVTGLQGRPVSNAAPGAGQVLEWGGASWAPGNVAIAPSGTGLVHVTGGVTDATAYVGTAAQIMVTNSAASDAVWITVTGDLSPSLVVPGQYSVGAISGSSPIPITPAVLQWVNSVAPQLTQAALGGSGAGNNFTIAPQGANTAGASGSLIVNVQAPASGTAEAGLVFQRAGTTLGILQGEVGTPANGALYLGSAAPSSTNFKLLDVGGVTTLNGSSVNTAAGGVTEWQVTSTILQSNVPTVQWGTSVSSPVLIQQTKTSDAATQTLKVAAQSAFASATGTNRNGGTLQLTGGLSSGVGTGVGGVIQANSGLAYRILNVSATTYTVDTNATASDLTIFTDSGANTVAVTLPTPTAGRLVWVKDKTGKAATHNVTISPHAAETIDGASSLVFTKNFDAALLESDGTNWSIMSEFSSSIVP